jgi:hypothetical protein
VHIPSSSFKYAVGEWDRGGDNRQDASDQCFLGHFRSYYEILGTELQW